VLLSIKLFSECLNVPSELSLAKEVHLKTLQFLSLALFDLFLKNMVQ